MDQHRDEKDVPRHGGHRREDIDAHDQRGGEMNIAQDGFAQRHIEQPPQDQLDQRRDRSGSQAGNQDHDGINTSKLAIVPMRRFGCSPICRQLNIFLTGDGNAEPACQALAALLHQLDVIADKHRASQRRAQVHPQTGGVHMPFVTDHAQRALAGEVPTAAPLQITTGMTFDCHHLFEARGAHIKLHAIGQFPLPRVAQDTAYPVRVTARHLFNTLRSRPPLRPAQCVMNDGVHLGQRCFDPPDGDQVIVGHCNSSQAGLTPRQAGRIEACSLSGIEHMRAEIAD